MKKNYQFPHGIPQHCDKLKVYEDCDYIIYACGYEDSDHLVLEVGKELILEVDGMSDDQVIERAKEDLKINEYDSDFKTESGEWDIEELRAAFTTIELDDLGLSSTPYGRARQLFEPLIDELRLSVDIRLDSSHAIFNNWEGVVVDSINSLFNLQMAMEERGIKINIIVEKF